MKEENKEPWFASALRRRGTKPKVRNKIPDTISEPRSSVVYAEDYWTDTEVQQTPAVIEEEVLQGLVTEENFISYLKELGNPLSEYDIEYFFKNSIERVKELAKSGEGILNILQEYLMILGMVEFKTDKSNINRVKEGCKFGLGYFGNTLKSNYKVYSLDTPWSLRESNYQASSCKFNVNRLPFCCGVSEYGDFVFNYVKQLSPILDRLKYNLFIDFIRLHSFYHRKGMTGAYSMVNYFVDTDFTKILETREDLQFIKKFTNPKTSATLKTFIFDTQI